ncbi:MULTISPECIES: DUF5655 domain-containing protein [unclassified Clostridium]|jgi:hypothetical protein|uniref:DUF5655 domain-containing protein n=1 Tax=Clostridia TaxID=186801 RepID=UPI0011063FFE|nr:MULTISPECIES: DUF5655 domain-containing protein [unclassified Clostridium]
MGCSDIERLMQYFNGVSEMMELFEALDKKVRAAFPKSTRRIQKSQISYDAQGHLFCALSKPVHRQKGWPAVSMILTFGLGTPLDSPRIFQVVQPYPGRWTHHTLLAAPEELDQEMLGFLGQAWAFTLLKFQSRGRGFS